MFNVIVDDQDFYPDVVDGVIEKFRSVKLEFK